MSLVDELKTIQGRKRRYLLLRIIGMQPEATRGFCGITRGTYNSWLQNEAFVKLHRQISAFASEYQKEALQLLRRNNQQRAVLLEEKILQKIDEELDSGKYDLIRTALGKEVYTKLVADLDYQPKNLNLTWEQRILALQTESPQLQESEVPQIVEEGEVINAEVLETTDKSETKYQEGSTITESIQTGQQAQEEAGD